MSFKAFVQTVFKLWRFYRNRESCQYFYLSHNGVVQVALFIARDREAWQTDELVNRYYANRLRFPPR
jgi:hypothetical protein